MECIKTGVGYPAFMNNQSAMKFIWISTGMKE